MPNGKHAKVEALIFMGDSKKPETFEFGKQDEEHQ